MKYKIWFLNYNNYYNRIVKSEPTIEDYSEYKLSEELLNNFYPNDNINTTIVVSQLKEDIGNYILVMDEFQQEILSRWFVLEATNDSTHRYKIQLKRDLIVDYRNNILSADSLIEKATLDDNDPMIYNKEPVSFNQIKKSENALLDETHSAWVVGYIPRGAMELEDKQKPWSETNMKHPVFDESVGNENIYGKIVATGTEDIKVNTLADWEYYQYRTNYFITNPLKKLITTAIKTKFAEDNHTYYPHIGFYEDGSQYIATKDMDHINSIQLDGEWFVTLTNKCYLTPQIPFKDILLDGYNTGYPNQQYGSGIGRLPKFTITDDIKRDIKNEFPDTFFDHTEIQTRNFLNLNGKILFEESTGKYYKIALTSPYKELRHYVMSENLAGIINNALDRRYYYKTRSTLHGTELDYDTLNYTELPEYLLWTSINKYEIRLTEIQNETIIGCPNFGKERYHLDDQPYDMFAIPIGNPFNPAEEIKILKDGVDTGLRPNLSIGLNIGTIISENLGSGNIYDIQLLPYCPVRYVVGDNATIDVKNSKVQYIYQYNPADGQNKPTPKTKKLGVIFWATHSSFTFNIPYSIPITEKKIQNQCDMHRLCSPNYNGLFDFNVARNNGVDYFNVDCSYKPFLPYIHINPNFKGLYGSDFNGTRGLICGGDFSLPQISDAWANFQMNNKNYSSIFNRETEHLDTMRDIDRTKEIWGLAAGTGQGVGAGAAMGSAGGIKGAVVGGVVGGILSVAGGLADLSLSDKAYKENMSFRNNLHNLQLDNIKAIPDSLTKVSAFNYNNKIFPFIEYYTCTDEEKEMFRNMLKYDGMTVNRIGNIRDFIKPNKTYIQGRIIRIADINEDYHLVSEINKEIEGGIYI